MLGAESNNALAFWFFLSWEEALVWGNMGLAGRGSGWQKGGPLICLWEWGQKESIHDLQGYFRFLKWHIMTRGMWADPLKNIMSPEFLGPSEPQLLVVALFSFPRYRQRIQNPEIQNSRNPKFKSNSIFSLKKLKKFKKLGHFATSRYPIDLFVSVILPKMQKSKNKTFVFCKSSKIIILLGAFQKFDY